MGESSREGKPAEFTAQEKKKIPVSEPDHSGPGSASEGKPLNSPTAALPHGKCSFHSIIFPVTKVNGPCDICLKVSELLADLPSAQRQEETEKAQDEQRAHKWQATGKRWLTFHSLRVQG